MIAIVQPFYVVVNGKKRRVLMASLTPAGEVVLTLAGQPPDLCFLSAVEAAWPEELDIRAVIEAP